MNEVENLEKKNAPEGRPFSEFREKGFLWLINKTVFHPRGYALAFHVTDDGEVTGWSLFGAGDESWKFSDDYDEDIPFHAVTAALQQIANENGQ